MVVLEMLTLATHLPVNRNNKDANDTRSSFMASVAPLLSTLRLPLKSLRLRAERCHLLGMS